RTVTRASQIDFAITAHLRKHPISIRSQDTAHLRWTLALRASSWLAPCAAALLLASCNSPAQPSRATASISVSAQQATDIDEAVQTMAAARDGVVASEH